MNLREIPAPAIPLARLLLVSNPLSFRLHAVNIGYFNPEVTDITGKTVIYTDVSIFTDILLY